MNQTNSKLIHGRSYHLSYSQAEITEINKTWWYGVKKWYKKKFPLAVVDESDPEYDAQKIYRHWLSSYKP